MYVPILWELVHTYWQTHDQAPSLRNKIIRIHQSLIKFSCLCLGHEGSVSSSTKIHPVSTQLRMHDHTWSTNERSTQNVRFPEEKQSNRKTRHAPRNCSSVVCAKTLRSLTSMTISISTVRWRVWKCSRIRTPAEDEDLHLSSLTIMTQWTNLSVSMHRKFNSIFDLCVRNVRRILWQIAFYENFSVNLDRFMHSKFNIS